MIRFHLDETTAKAVAVQLRLRGVDITTTQEAGLMGRSDADQLRHATAEGRCLLTEDDDCYRESLKMPDHAGILYSPKQLRSIGEIVDFAQLFANVMSQAEVRGQVFVVPKS